MRSSALALLPLFYQDADGLPVTAIAEYQGTVLPDPEEFDESDVSDDDESMEYSPGP